MFPCNPDTIKLPDFGETQKAYLLDFFQGPNQQGLTKKFKEELEGVYRNYVKRCRASQVLANEHELNQFVTGWILFRTGALHGQTITAELANKQMSGMLQSIEIILDQLAPKNPDTRKYGLN